MMISPACSRNMSGTHLSSVYASPGLFLNATVESVLTILSGLLSTLSMVFWIRMAPSTLATPATMNPMPDSSTCQTVTHNRVIIL